jgi:hypothetical protein
MKVDPRGLDMNRNGAFMVRLQKETGVIDNFKIIAASGGGWDHVSVSLDTRCPTWPEMSIIHRIFFKPDEVAMQLHVPESAHINNHPYCLHLWRPWSKLRKIPMPPRNFV